MQVRRRTCITQIGHRAAEAGDRVLAVTETAVRGIAAFTGGNRCGRRIELGLLGEFRGDDVYRGHRATPVETERQQARRPPRSLGRMHPRIDECQQSSRADRDQHVLFVVYLVRNGRRRNRRARRDRPQQLAAIRGVGGETAFRIALEDEVACRCHDAAVERQLVLHRPARLARERVERDELAGTERIAIDLGDDFERIGKVAVLVVAYDARYVDDGDIAELVPGMPGHRVPAVCAPHVRPDRDDGIRIFGPVLGVGQIHGAFRFQVDMRGPVDFRELVGGQQLAGQSIEHVVEAVLRRDQKCLARRAADLEFGQRDIHRRVVVPAVVRHRLIVPDVLARIGAQRDHRRQEQVVAAAGTAQRMHVRQRAGRAEEQQARFRVVGHLVPGTAAAAELLERVAGPARGCHLHCGRGVLGGDVARHRVETPQQRAAVGGVGRNVAPVLSAGLGPGVADENLVSTDVG